MNADDRYVVISADCHAGAAIDTYRDYLEPGYRDEFDAWRKDYRSPFEDLQDEQGVKYRRNFEPELRIPDLEKEGIVGEVIFPNTIPPFFGGNAGDVKGLDAEDLDRKWAGIHAHNRWLVDFCDELPGRRAGIAQILADDLDRAVEEVRWIGESKLFGGVLLPIPAPNSSLPPLHAPDWEPVWTACEETGVVVNTHAGSGMPDHGNYSSSGVMMFLEFAWYAQRPLVRLLMSGVMERHPDMTFVVTETGNAWVPEALAGLDGFYDLAVNAPPNTPQERFGRSVKTELSRKPSEYWARQCFIGASFAARHDVEKRYETGVDTIMWGADYPHTEGTFPYTAESLRAAYAGVPYDEVQQMLGGNAARCYGFDFDKLAVRAAAIGPRVGDIDTELAEHDIPAEARTMAFAGRAMTG